MKHTRIYKGEEAEWYGFNLYGMIAVNIELLWKEAKNEDKFIKDFAKTYTHELLHQLFDDIATEIRIYREEEIIRKILKEPWNKQVREEYK